VNAVNDLYRSNVCSFKVQLTVVKASPKLYFFSLRNDPPHAETRTHKAGDFLLFLSPSIETTSPAVSIISGSSLAQIPLPQTYTQQN